jgi:hypothetical protein
VTVVTAGFAFAVVSAVAILRILQLLSRLRFAPVVA